MDELMGEHGGTIVSGIIAVVVLLAIVVVVISAGNLDLIATLSVIGG